MVTARAALRTRLVILGTSPRMLKMYRRTNCNAGRPSSNTARLRVSCHFERVIEIFWIVQDALAGIASDDLVVLANLLKDLRPDPNLADFADLITSRRHTDSTAMLSDALVS